MEAKQYFFDAQEPMSFNRVSTMHGVSVSQWGAQCELFASSI